MPKRVVLWVVLWVLAASIKIFSLFPDAVEQYYSTGIYPFISRFQRALFGWIPFSIGDLLYAAVIIFLLYRTFLFFRQIFNRKAGKQFWLGTLRKIVLSLLLLYISFNLLWGLNYNRRGIAYQLKLPGEEIKAEDIRTVMQVLQQKVNQYAPAAVARRDSIASSSYLFKGATESYQLLSREETALHYKAASVKSSLYSYLGNYLGYTGYYNPFTGEAQVNTKVPLFIQPFTACHEIGHQLGYAKENEANFAGYLSAKCSTDPAFLYSVYFDLYSYGRPYLYYTDSLALKKTDSALNPVVKKDFRELRQFYLSHSNPVERIIDKAYGQYLKANDQPAGKITYGQVIIWLVAYYRAYGKEAL